MSAGLQIRNAANTVILDYGDSIGRTLGTVVTGGVDGSITDANLSLGTPWSIVPSNNMSGGTYVQPVGLAGFYVSFSGTTMSWTYQGYTPTTNITIIYGIF